MGFSFAFAERFTILQLGSLHSKIEMPKPQLYPPTVKVHKCLAEFREPNGPLPMYTWHSEYATDKRFDIQYYQNDWSPQATLSHQDSCELYYYLGLFAFLHVSLTKLAVGCVSAAPSLHICSK